MSESMYHAGMRALQDEFDGRRVADALEAKRRHHAFWPAEIALIEEASFFFLATQFETSIDCSFKGGAPGFVKVTGPSTLEWPDYDGNSMYRSLGNIACNPRLGLLFMRFDGKSDLMRASGTATLSRDPADLARHHAAKLVVRFTAEIIFPNCPRYIPDLREAAPSVYNPTPGDTPPDAPWKSRDYIRDILPKK